MKYKIGSLFAGIGGFELGFEATGQFETAWQVECDKYALRVLEKHWPNVTRHNDVNTWPLENTEPVDVVLAGFPCQDISYAGMGAGLNGKRSGLFYQAMRIVRVLGPKFVVLENVAALFIRGLDQVLGTLAALGYDAEWEIVSAASVGALHRRDRVFIIGWNTGGSGATLCDTYGNCKPTSTVDAKAYKLQGDLADTSSKRSAARVSGTTRGSQRDAKITINCCDRLRRGTASNRWAVEPAVGRVADGVPRRVDRLKCLGNAIVPQVAQVVAERLLEILDEQDPKPTV